MWKWVGVFCVASLSWARLPTGLSSSDIDRLVEYLGAPATTRLMRSAETYAVFPGVRFAIEVMMLPTGDLNELGDRNGTFAPMNPTPRFSFSKGLLYGFEFQLNYFPTHVMNVLSGMGGSIKWNFIDEKEAEFSASAFGAYTSLTGFEQTYQGASRELGVVLSKDFVRVRPYLGGGLILSSAEVSSNYAAVTQEREGSFYTVHSFLGCEFELPAAIAVQMDLMNLSPSLTLLVGMSW